jgi:hypothetical protein
MATSSADWQRMFGAEAPKPGSAVDGRASKRMAVSVDDPSLQDLSQKVELALKMAVIATNKSRETEAILCSSIPIKKDGPLNAAMSTAHAEYLKKTKGNKGHGLGDGSTFRFGALMIAICGDKIECPEKETIKSTMSKFDPNACLCKRTVRLCKTEVMHDSASVRFKLSIPASYELECCVIDCIQKIESAVQWFGPRPAGYLEQEAQKLLGSK